MRGLCDCGCGCGCIIDGSPFVFSDIEGKGSAMLRNQYISDEVCVPLFLFERTTVCGGLIFVGRGWTAFCLIEILLLNCKASLEKEGAKASHSVARFYVCRDFERLRDW
jgi:hypothetical protein